MYTMSDTRPTFRANFFNAKLKQISRNAIAFLLLTLHLLLPVQSVRIIDAVFTGTLHDKKAVLKPFLVRTLAHVYGYWIIIWHLSLHLLENNKLIIQKLINFKFSYKQDVSSYTFSKIFKTDIFKNTLGRLLAIIISIY